MFLIFKTRFVYKKTYIQKKIRRYEVHWVSLYLNIIIFCILQNVFIILLTLQRYVIMSNVLKILCRSFRNDYMYLVELTIFVYVLTVLKICKSFLSTKYRTANLVLLYNFSDKSMYLYLMI